MIIPIHSIRYSIAFLYSSWRETLKTTTLILYEVTGYTPWKIEERMKLRNQIKQIDPDCKIAFLVDEKADPAVAQKVRRAKTDGLIDQFIYTSISASYLLGVMETL